MAHVLTHPDPIQPSRVKRTATRTVARAQAETKRTELVARLITKAKDADMGKTVSLAGLSDEDLIASLRQR